jgi:hypothetical protein
MHRCQTHRRGALLRPRRPRPRPRRERGGRTAAHALIDFEPGRHRGIPGPSSIPMQQRGRGPSGVVGRRASSLR